MEQDRAGGHRDALEVGGEARRQPVGAGGGGVLPPRLVEARGGKQRVLAPLQPPVQVGLEDRRALGLVHASARELCAHRIGGAGEDDLESGGLRQAITFTNETTAEESTPVTRRRSITRKRGGGAAPSGARTRSSRRFVDPKNTNPLTRRIWTRSESARSSARSVAGRSTLER